MKPRTRLVHPRPAPLPADNRPLVGPIFQSVKFGLDTLEATQGVWRHARPGYSYSRDSNPSVRELEQAVADLQGTEDALVVASGMAAVSAALLPSLKSGSHVLLFLETYLPTRRLVGGLLERFGVSHTLLSIEDREAIERLFAERPPELVWFESPTNPMLKIADIDHLAGLARARGALLVLDNTFAGLHQHGGTGVDLYVHSLTKYASGHGDVMAGAVAGSRAAIDKLRGPAALLGATLDPHAAFLVSRGLKTYFLRRAAATQSAAEVARFLAAEPFVARVHYPGLPGHPGHELATRQMEDYGSIVTVDLRGGERAMRVFTDSLTLFAITPSVGSTESLIVPAQLLGMQGLGREAAARAGLTVTTARLSIGLEDPEDLIDDLRQALAHASAAEYP
jgi:cystathionine beta-lyase/cystathionine gamma-synthase